MKYSLHKPSPGTTRRKFGFLWLPKTINNQIRWLEWAHWSEKYTTHTTCVGTVSQWLPISWN